MGKLVGSKITPDSCTLRSEFIITNGGKIQTVGSGALAHTTSIYGVWRGLHDH